MRPGTKVLGRPSAPIAIATSRVSAVSEICASVGIASVWLSPSLAAQSGLQRLQAVEQFGRGMSSSIGVALAVVEAEGLDPGEALQRPGQTGRGILAAGKQHQRGLSECKIWLMRLPLAPPRRAAKPRAAFSLGRRDRLRHTGPSPSACGALMTPSRDIARLLEIMAALRTPGTGCPWDLEQNFATIAPYTIEEAYEVAEAIARGDLDDLRDELGDLLLQVVFHARMAEEPAPSRSATWSRRSPAR